MSDIPQVVKDAVLVKSDEVQLETAQVEGYDFSKGVNYKKILEAFKYTGFQATNFGLAVDEINRMIDWRLSDEPIKEDDKEELRDPAVRAKTKCTIFLGYTSNLVSSGVRETIRYLVQNKMVDCLVTTAGGIEEDLIKCLAPTHLGDFRLKGAELREKGINRIGNLLVPNNNYCAFEDWIIPVFDKMLEEQTSEGINWTPSKLIARLGLEINNESSICYWAAKNGIPIFSPAITDGSIGDMLYFHSYRNPGLKVDLVEDIRLINDIAVHAPKTGMIILGGGVIKHHINNANLMRNGADFAVYINTAHEFDGSDAGARPDEAVSWGKIKVEAKSVKLHAEVTLVFPLIVSQTFAKDEDMLEDGGMEDFGVEDVTEQEAAPEKDAGDTLVLLTMGIKDLALPKATKLQAVLSEQAGDGSWKEIGRTEVHRESPAGEIEVEWLKEVEADYHFDRVQKLRAEVFDENDASKPIASSECTLAQVMGSRHQAVEVPLHEAGATSEKMGPELDRGMMRISGHEANQENIVLKLRMKGRGIPLSRQKAFLRMSSFDPENEEFHPLTNTEERRSGSVITWKPMKLSTNHLCGGDYDRPVLVQCMETNGQGDEPVVVGQAKVSINKLTNKKITAFPLRDPVTNKKKGMVQLLDAVLLSQPSFLDFISSGWQMQFDVAIDFTASNGQPSNPRSLHYVDPAGETMNEYVKAIHASGDILECYSYDKTFPVYGFGGIMQRRVSHCFPLSGSEDAPGVMGVEGILSCYNNVMSKVRLSGPTKFNEVISTVAAKARHDHESRNRVYHTLLIITDGVINDMEKTIATVVNNAELPLSIIIVGVGAAEFDAMEVLDGDEERLKHEGKVAARDMVQFVSLREFESSSSQEISHELLEEVPGQLLDYMELHDIQPDHYQGHTNMKTAATAVVSLMGKSAE